MLFVFLCMLPAAAQAQAAPDTEQQIKAGFIYNFALFAQWPEKAFKDSSAPLSLCIAGDTATVEAFAPLTAKKILDRPVMVHAFGDNATRQTCHIIYIDSTNKAEAADMLRRASRYGVLTIGHLDGFCRLGGIINFYHENNKLRFEINTDAAGRAGIKFSSRLLNLAKIVREEKP
jgi:hypothetical protein